GPWPPGRTFRRHYGASSADSAGADEAGEEVSAPLVVSFEPAPLPVDSVASLFIAPVPPAPAPVSVGRVLLRVLTSEALKPPALFSVIMDNMHSRIQKQATTTVTRVNTSPALVPKALWPPAPPSAPVRPPPRPRWTSTSRIRNSEVRNSKIPRTYCPRAANNTGAMDRPLLGIAKSRNAKFSCTAAGSSQPRTL